jgi:hypothetical protein
MVRPKRDKPAGVISLTGAGEPEPIMPNAARAPGATCAVHVADLVNREALRVARARACAIA